MPSFFHSSLFNSIFSLLIACLAATLAACDNETIDNKVQIVRPAKIITVDDPMSEAKRVYPGEVEAGNRSEQAFRVGGELVQLPAKAGIEVKQNDLLAQIDPSDFQLRVDEQQARFDLAQVQFDRTATLVKKQLIPKSDFDKAKSNLLSAKADLKLAKANLSYTELRAPFDGIISTVNVKNHENIQPNEVILVMRATDNIDITFNLSENIIARLKKKNEEEAARKKTARVVFDSHPEKSFTAIVSEFDSEADPKTRSYKITLSMPAPKEFIAFPGMSVSVHLDFNDLIGQSTSTLIIPIEAVFSPEDTKLKSNNRSVWKVDPQSMTTHLTNVETGQITADGIEITSGLNPGDQVIAAGVNFIMEGQQVRPWIQESGL